MTQQLFLLSTLLALNVEGISSFVSTPRTSIVPKSNGAGVGVNQFQPTTSSCSPSSKIFSGVVDGNIGVEEASLAGLGDDHESVGDSMAKSVAAWLDDEWMPQEVHVRMGTSVKTTYVQCRKSGIDDVASIMTQVTDDLYERWSEYDKDAFVNAWDIGNYVADYLISKSGSETCGCSNQIYE